MTATLDRMPTKTWLYKETLNALMEQAGINNKTDRQTVRYTIRAIGEAARKERATFPDAKLSQAVSLAPKPEYYTWDYEPDIVDLDSVRAVMASPLLVGAVRRHKHRSMTDAAITTMGRFVAGLERFRP
jgi:hypothetical protein